MCEIRILYAYFNELFKLRGFFFVFCFFFVFKKCSVGVLRGAKALWSHCLSVINGVEQWEARTPASAA